MRLNELRKLVNETVRQEQRKSRKRSGRNFNRIVESAVRSVINEDVTFSQAYGDKTDKYGETPADKLAASGDQGANNKFLQLGQGKQDIIEAGGTFGPTDAANLKASQAEVIYTKAISFAAGFLKGEDGFKPSGDIGGIITEDGQILDGHHRWAGAYIVNPKSQLSGTAIKMGWEQAIPVLRAIGVAFGHNTGNAGDASDSVWGPNGDLDEAAFGELFTKMVVEKSGGWENQKGVTKYCEGFDKYDPLNEDDQKKLIKYLYKNYQKLRADGAPPAGMPSRIDMPVLVSGAGEDKEDDKGRKTSQANALGSDEVKAATDLLNKGKIDVKPDYSEEMENAVANESIDLRRWNKLAGLLKD